MYKLIALDIDDTLLGSDRKLHEIDRAAIARGKAAGIKFTIATGRSYRGSREIMAQAGLSEMPVINYGGAQTSLYPSGEIIHVDGLDLDIVRELIRFADELGAYIQIYDGDDYFFRSVSEENEYYKARIGYAGKTADILTHEFKSVSKCLLIASPERARELAALLREHFAGRLTVSGSNPRYVEINALGVDKGKALRFLTGYLGLTREEVIAVGDNTIDLAMIRYAGMGVAVGNAADIVKQEADYIAPTNDEHAVAHVIEKFIFGEG